MRTSARSARTTSPRPRSASRDDAEGKFLTYYLEHGVLERNLFEVLDRDGVGDLMRIAVERGRGVKPDLKLGICGEHGGEPRSVAFCHELGLDYVSRSPYRAAARTARGRAGGPRRRRRDVGRRRRLTHTTSVGSTARAARGSPRATCREPPLASPCPAGSLDACAIERRGRRNHEAEPGSTSGALPPRTGRRRPSAGSPVVAAVVIGGAVGTKQLDEDGAPGESGRMASILDDSFRGPAEESVLVASDTLTVKSPAFAAAVDAIAVARVSATRWRRKCRARSPGPTPTVSRRTAARPSSEFPTSAATPDDAADRIAPVVAAVEGAKAAHPDPFVGSFGETTADEEIMESVGSDLERAGLLALPVTLVVFVLAFGALVAAGILLLLALTAVIAIHGPPRPAESRLARGRERERGRAADRARGRRRLLALLLEARARGTSGRAE